MFDIFYLDKPPNIFPHERWAKSLDHAREQSRTRYLWIADARNDYSQFDWLWEPSPWQSQQTHVWPSQHQANGGTWLIPRQGMGDINRDHQVIARVGSVPILGIDHGDGLVVPCDKRTRYISDYLGTLRRTLAQWPSDWAWIVSSVCDYSNFDFTWHPSEWQHDMLHVFASGDQKFGDTFYVHVPSFLQKSQGLALLEWFDTVHYVENISVPRRPVPVVMHDHDSQVPAVWEHDFQAPVVQFAIGSASNAVPAINLWRREVKAIVPLTAGATRVLVPREAKTVLKTQLYDYDVIDRSKNNWLQDPALDIVFITNGEHGAEHHWQVLNESVQRSRNRVHRVDGVNGRVAAYQAAALKSTTPWFFAVFAKLQVNQDFDWSWQPDRMQQAKHYIFHAYNPVNHLVYGHQAMIAYNRDLVMKNPAEGLDFTLDQPHEVIPIVSGTAYYDNDPWTCWRTAFRECIKLRHSLPDVENEYRLQQWLTVGDGTNGSWSCAGAQDALEYYDRVQGQFDHLRKTYEWAWLASYAMIVQPRLFTTSKT